MAVLQGGVVRRTGRGGARQTTAPSSSDRPCVGCEQMSLCRKDKVRVVCVEGVVLVEREVEVLERLACQKARLLVLELARLNVEEGSHPALDAGAVVEVVQHPLSQLEVPLVLGGPVEKEIALDELGSQRVSCDGSAPRVVVGTHPSRRRASS